MLAILCLLTLTLAAPALAGQSGIPGAFADVGLGARAMGLGGAVAAGSGFAGDLVWNPAGLALLERSEFTAMQTEQFGLVPTYFLAGALARNEGFGLAAGIISSGDALLRENTLLVGAGRHFDALGNLDLGMTLKMRYASFGSGGTGEAVTGSAYGFALDIGLRGKLGPAELGFYVEELVGTVSWDSSERGSYYESVPPTASAGMQLPAGPLRLATDIEIGLAGERPVKAALGVEWTPHPILQLRGGMRQSLDAEASRFLSLGAGLGRDLEQGGRLQLDTAYLFHELGGSLRVSAAYRF